MLRPSIVRGLHELETGSTPGRSRVTDHQVKTRNRTPAEPVPHSRSAHTVAAHTQSQRTHSRNAQTVAVAPLPEAPAPEVALFCESRSDGRHKPRTSVRGNGEKRAPQSPAGTTGWSTHNISVVPAGLWGVRCFLTMDLRPWLLHVMPSAFKKSRLQQRPRGLRFTALIHVLHDHITARTGDRQYARPLTRHGSQSHSRCGALRHGGPMVPVGGTSCV